MKKIYLQAFKTTNENIIIAFPLILFVWIFNLYSAFTKYTVDTAPEYTIASITVMFMVSAFFGGWLYMVKGAVDVSKKIYVMDTDRANATWNLLKLFPAGIGKYFLSLTGVQLIMFVFQTLFFVVVYSLGTFFIKVLDQTSLQNLMDLLSVQSANGQGKSVTAFVNSLTPEQQLFLLKLSLIIVLFSAIFYFLIMFWMPEIIYHTLNPLKALFIAVKKLFKTFFKSLLMFVSVWLLIFLITILYCFSVVAPVIFLIMSVVLFYFFVFMIILLFVYYDMTFNTGNTETVKSNND